MKAIVGLASTISLLLHDEIIPGAWFDIDRYRRV